MTDDTRLLYLWLALTFGPASKLAVKLLDALGSPDAIFSEKLHELRPGEALSEKELDHAKALVKTHTFAEAEQMLERCHGMGIDILTPDSAAYPDSLRYLPDRPLTLYLRGTMPDCNTNMTTAVVGTRKMTEYGRTMAYSLGVGLTYGGSIVVSGMALGSDSMALIGALDAGGQVIAVLGSGVDVIYPREHRDIYRKIVERGAVISEYPPGTPPIGSHFPVRNRIMSGIADATVVVEADARSGSLITAAHAFDQGKKVFAVPGKIGDAGSEGTNNLIRDGALAVLTAEDILAEFEFIYPHTVSVQRAHAMLHGKEMDELSRTAMARTRINTRTETGSLGRANYYGSGTYGGRRNEYPVPAPVSSERVPAPVPREPEPAAEEPVPKKKPRPVNVVKSFFGLEKDKDERKNDKQRVNSDKKIVPAKKIELDMLDETEIKVYNKMKPSVPTLPDELVDAETSVSVVMSALTMLEMAGAVESGGGGYFMRVQPDDIMQSEND
ncbi:MAG: DNA-processing protein DprA [Clostridia bacterium]|nr:DNA-processing protein DprA [Clostridia bacterium]